MAFGKRNEPAFVILFATLNFSQDKKYEVSSIRLETYSIYTGYLLHFGQRNASLPVSGLKAKLLEKSRF